MKSPLVLLIGLLAVLPARGQTETIVSPAISVGNDPNLLSPFLSDLPVRYQQIYSSSEFQSAIPGGGYLTQIAFRSGPFPGVMGATASNLQVNFSTSAKDPQNLSSAFKENLGSDDTVVLGPTALSLTRPPGSHDFDFVVRFGTPFFYDPSHGSLLMEVRNFSGTRESSPGNFSMDADSRPGNPVSAILALSSSAESGFVGIGSGLITQFTFTPVPEPTCLSLAIGFILGFVFRAARNKLKRG